jgi:Xaa-Pro aminopeptidase
VDPDLSVLDAFLDGEQTADGYLIDAASDDSSQRYLSGFDAPDPFVTLYRRAGVSGPASTTDERSARRGVDGPGGSTRADGTVHLLVKSLEFGRARRTARADEIVRYADYDFQSLAAEHGRQAAEGRVLAAFLADRGVEAVAVPARFPLGTADGLRERDLVVRPDYDDAVERARAVKTDEEVEYVRAAQRANEAAIGAAEAAIRNADVVDGVLHADGEPLTSESVQRTIEATLLEHGCALDEAIVACGADAADPHDRGSGPLRADDPIVVDVFPRSKATGYHADTTRTFLRGEASETVEAWFDIVDRARRAAIDAVEPGVTGASVHDAACEVIEDAGLPTLREDPTTETGFIHSTGHGVGLDVHERPRIAPDGEELEPGHVITIEPGLYDPDVGGVRIEDLLVVTPSGAENLTDYPISLTG